MSNNNQSNRLTAQHKLSQGVIGIFGDYAKAHDLAVGEVSKLVKDALSEEYPQLSFRYRDSIRKTEINES
ncbi:restriction endonuclease, partial [Salmonella enterica]|nr:restriction endonuclease [Salmonella enterica subsp. enterica serovar Essen]EIY5081676.1 restriction endonuclease [Klebsiella quasipneumoniae]EJB7392148.1 restriction endonuclease [Salmonella enterica]